MAGPASTRQWQVAAFAESAADAVIQVDLGGAVRAWNQGAERLYGHPAEYALGRDAADLLAPGDGGHQLRLALGSGELRDFAGHHLRGDGTRFPASGTVWPVSDGEEGAVTGSVIVVRARDEAELARRRLMDQTQQLHDAQRVAGLGAWAWQPGASQVTWTDELYRIYGLDPESYEPTVEGYLERVHPDDRELAIDHIATTFATGKPFEYQERIVRPDGEVRVLHSKGRLLADAGGQRVIGVSHDITDRVEAERQLREAVDRLNEAQEIGRIGSWEWDVATNAVIWSDVLHDIYGVPPDAFGASFEDFLELVVEEDRERVERVIRGAFEEAEPFDFRHRLTRPDGSVRTLDCRGRVVRAEDGRPLRMVGTALDVTEQIEAEGKLAAAAAQLEVARRIANLLNITEAALSHLSLDDLLPELLDRICGALGTEQAAVFLVEEDGGAPALSARRGIDGSGSLRLDDGFARRVVEERRTIRLEAGESGDEADAGPGIRSLLGVPLAVDDEVVGTVCVGSRDSRRFSDDEVAMLQLAAERAGLAIRHARLYERERRIAETLQRSLLPDTLPTTPGVGLAARYLPATAEVGGDWYDAIPLPGGVGLVLGDVSGHGIPAAALMAELRHTLRAYALDGRSLVEVVERLDRLIRDRRNERIATLVYGALEPGNRFRYVSAGHLPPLAIEGAAARFLPLGEGPPLGCHGGYAETTVQLAPDALVVLYSDGLVERRRESIDAGLERLRAAAERGARTPERLCDELVGTLLPGSGRDDDVAVVVAEPRLSGE